LTVSLEYYWVEPSSGIKTKIDPLYDWGNIFKGNEQKVAIAIYNIGDEPAVGPIVQIDEYLQEGKDYSEAVIWKTLSLGENADFSTSVICPDIPAQSWMPGKDIYYEDFSGWPFTRTPLDNTWSYVAGGPTVWQVYSAYLEHSSDSQHGLARWNELALAKDFTFSANITVQHGTYAGYVLRDAGDMDTGYLVLIQGNTDYFSGIPYNEGKIQVYTGKFTNGPASWTLRYESGTIGIRGTHDYFKVKLSTVDNKPRFDFWYNNKASETPLYSFVDSVERYANASRPVLATHPGASGGVLNMFDELRMEVDNPDGRIWIKNNVRLDTALYGRQYSIFRVRLGAE
jgi:hypothetical protein